MSESLPRVELRLPQVLKLVVGRDRLQVRGRTLPEVFEAAYEELPQLRYHLMLESNELRPHVLCLVNGDCIGREDFATTAVRDGDEVLVHQAISGG